MEKIHRNRQENTKKERCWDGKPLLNINILQNLSNENSVLLHDTYTKQIRKSRIKERTCRHSMYDKRDISNHQVKDKLLIKVLRKNDESFWEERVKIADLVAYFLSSRKPRSMIAPCSTPGNLALILCQ
jgi:hypothetical protein